MKTILLVNNNPSVVDGLAELLRRCRYAVIATRDGSAALAEIASEERIDLVITDHQVNGIGELAILKAHRQKRPDVPVIILTARGTLDSYLKAINLGVTEYLENTVGSRELLCIIAAALGDGEEEKRGNIRSFPHFRAGTEAVRTAYDRGYLEVVRS